MQLIDPKDIKKDRFFITSAASKIDHIAAFGESKPEIFQNLEDQAHKLSRKSQKTQIPRKFYLEKQARMITLKRLETALANLDTVVQKYQSMQGLHIPMPDDLQK